jgi:hemoglobin
MIDGGAGVASPVGPGAPSAAMSASRDLQAEDLYETLVAFYARVETEPLLAPYFVPVDMVAHMPRIESFWATMLFHAGTYSGSAFQPHLRMPGLTSRHFERWVATLEATLDARFSGPMSEQMKALARRIAYSMQVRLGIEPFAALQPYE